MKLFGAPLIVCLLLVLLAYAPRLISADNHEPPTCVDAPRLDKFAMLDGPCAKVVLAYGELETGTKVTVLLCFKTEPGDSEPTVSVFIYVGHEGHQVYDFYWTPEYAEPDGE